MSLKSLSSVQMVFALQHALTLWLAVLPCTQCAVIRCDPHNRDPCTKFPSLCTDGGGLCVIKGPCEYECVCPPDGRRGRDCSRSGSSSNPSKETDQTVNQQDSHVESLLVFPKNLFWDMNHAGEPFELMGSSSGRPTAEGIGPLTSTIKVQENKTIFEMSTNANAKPDTLRPLESKVTTTTLPGTIKKSPDFHLESTLSIPAGVTLSPLSSTAKSSEDLSTQSLIHMIIGKLSTNHVVNTENNGASTTMPSTQDTLSDSASNRMTSAKEGKIQVSASKPNTGVNAGKNNIVSNQLPTMSSAVLIRPTSTEKVSAPIIIGSDELANKSGSQMTNLNVSETSSVLNRGGNMHTKEQSNSVGLTDLSPSSSSQMESAKPDGVELPPASGNQNVSREPFPGHETFPTFFSGNIQGSSKADDDKPNAPLAFVVHRVYHAPDEFPVFRRPRQ